MMIYLLSVLLAAACGLALLPVLRRAAPVAVAATGRPIEVEVELELPAELQDLPEPPVLQAAPVQILDRAEIFRRLRELELGAGVLEQPRPEHDSIVAAALTAIGDAATQKRYFPRRPSLLPQLMRAVNDEEVSRRELTAIIARDPSLVGSLLKMANSPFYRLSRTPVESIERAIVILGSDGLRSLIAGALMQPIFKMAGAGRFERFPDTVWEHAQRSAHAAIPHAALVERADGFAAELLSLLSGLAEIVLFRAAMDHYAAAAPLEQATPLMIASLLDSQAATFAWRIGADWELSELMLGALEEQMVASEPTTPLGRSLRFGRCAGALAVLHSNSVIDEPTLRLSLPDAGLSPAHLKCMLTRLLNEQEDPRMAAGAGPSKRRLEAARRLH